MKTKGPMLATAWRQRRVRSSPVSVLGAGVIQAPPLVSSITVLVASSTWVHEPRGEAGRRG
jgi:hypothetical protein